MCTRQRPYTNSNNNKLVRAELRSRLPTVKPLKMFGGRKNKVRSAFWTTAVSECVHDEEGKMQFNFNGKKIVYIHVGRVGQQYVVFNFHFIQPASTI